MLKDFVKGLHDEFFRFIFSQLNILREFLRYLMPEDIISTYTITQKTLN